MKDTKEIKSKRKGSVHAVVYRHALRLPKSLEGHTLIKTSTMYGRFGVRYGELKAVKGKASNGSRASLVKWIDGYEGVNPNGETVIAFYPMPNNASLRSESRFEYDGKPVAKQDLDSLGIKPYIYQSGGEFPNMLTLKLANIVSVK